MFADGTAGEVGDGVGGPDDGEGEEEEAGAVGGNAVKADSERQWKGDEKKGAGGDAGGGECFDERAASEESEDG